MIDLGDVPEYGRAEGMVMGRAGGEGMGVFYERDEAG